MAEIKTKTRHGWRWAGGIVFALLLVALLGFMTWTHIEENVLQRRIDALRAAGEPMLPADFVPTIPDGEDNAANDLVAAAAMVNEETEAARALNRNEIGLPLRPDEREFIPRVLDESDAFALIDIAMTRPRCDWSYHLRSPVMLMMCPELNGERALALRLKMASLLDHERGDDAAALSRVDRMMFVSRSLYRHPSLVGFLVATGCGAMAVSTVEDLAPDMRIGTSSGSAPPSEVRRIIDLLLDDQPSIEGFRQGMRAERMSAIDTLMSPSVATVPTGLPTRTRWLFRPMVAANAVVIIDYTSGMIGVADAPNLAAAKARMPKLPKSVKAKPTPYYAFAQILLPSLDRTAETRFRYVTEARLAATALAIRWYATEHDGRLPARLQDLVPKYLPAIPLDPFAPTDQPIQYLSDPTDPRVYSVGTNGTDEGGSDKGTSSRKTQTIFTDWEREDRVHHLTRRPRPPEVPNDE